MPEAGETRRLLGLADRLRGPAVASAVEALSLPPGGHGLDVGCGMGSQMEALVEATAPGGKVTGLDPQGGHLAAGRRLTDAAGISDRVSFRRESNILRYDYSSLTTPSSVYDFSLATGEAELVWRQEILGEFDPADYGSERLHARAPDGALVPISIVYLKGTEKDGQG